jgi:drug/metabolite transporter (DMT)-like permease
MLLAYVSFGDVRPRPLLVLQATVISLTVLIWTAPPLADLLLLRTAEGRQALDPLRKAAAVGTAALLAVACASGVALQQGGSGAAALAGVLAVMFTIPLSTAPRTRPGRQRAVFGAVVGVLVAFAIIAVVRFAQRQDDAVLWLMASAAGLVYTDLLAEHLPGRR